MEKLLLQEFQNRQNRYIQLDGIISERLSDMIERKHYFVMEVAHRVKTVDSLRGKLNAKQGKYKDILDITDLCGVRIICYFSDEVDKIADSIREIFLVDEENSIDKREMMQATQFGYLSLHYICSLRPEDGYEKELTEIRFEIQIRTVLQHAWAEIEHDLGYKSEFGVPRPIRRDFSRVASLLEVADEQFVNLRENTKHYVIDTREKIREGTAGDLTLDHISLAEYIAGNLEFNEQLDRLSKEMKIEIIPADVSRYLKRLDWLGVRTIGDLTRAFRECEEIVHYLILQKVEQLELDIIAVSMVIRSLTLAKLMRGDYSDEQILFYMQLYIDDPEKAQKEMERLKEKKRAYLKQAK